MSAESAVLPPRRRGLAAKPWWPKARGALGVLFIIVVIGLIANQARTVDWPSVLASIRAYPASTLLGAAALAGASHAVYCTYDLIGRHQTGHRLASWRVAEIGFVSYAFNLNLGSLVGGVALRYRLYASRGLSTGLITQILVLSLVTNWLGYVAVAGLAFMLQPIALPAEWNLDSAGLRFLGAGLLALAAAYIGGCFGSKRRSLRWRGQTLRLPSGRVALLQLGLSALAWLLIAGVVYRLMPATLGYPEVLSVLLVAAVAGVISHVPAGLGVLETVFVTLLWQRAPVGALLAALIVYRAVYYLAPLALAGALFFAIERRATTARPAG